MHILNISFDSSILNSESVSAERMLWYGAVVDKYYIVVPSAKKTELKLSDKVWVFGSGGRWKICRLFLMYKTAKKILAKENFDFITTQDPFESGLIGYLLKRKFSLALNVQEHGDFFSNPYWRRERFLHALRYRLGIFIIKKADTVRAVSRRIKNYLISELKIKSEKITVVPVYVPLNDAKIKKIEHSGFVFLSIGRFVKQKNLPLLLKSFAVVSEKHPEAKLLLVGEGPEEEKLRNLSRELGIEKKVEFRPWVKDVASVYAEADTYVLSSDYEGWGRVIVEAVDAGLPIVMTDAGCAGETVVDKESALISSVGDQEELTENMLKIIENADISEKLVKNAKFALGKLPDKNKTLTLYKNSWQ